MSSERAQDSGDARPAPSGAPSGEDAPSNYLLLGLGLFHSHRAVILVLLEHAEVADAGLVRLAEELHGLAVQGALAGLASPLSWALSEDTSRPSAPAGWSGEGGLVRGGSLIL